MIYYMEFYKDGRVDKKDFYFTFNEAEKALNDHDGLVDAYGPLEINTLLSRLECQVFPNT